MCERDSCHSMCEIFLSLNMWFSSSRCCVYRALSHSMCERFLSLNHHATQCVKDSCHSMYERFVPLNVWEILVTPCVILLIQSYFERLFVTQCVKDSCHSMCGWFLSLHVWERFVLFNVWDIRVTQCVVHFVYLYCIGLLHTQCVRDSCRSIAMSQCLKIHVTQRVKEIYVIQCVRDFGHAMCDPLGLVVLYRALCHSICDGFLSLNVWGIRINQCARFSCHSMVRD